MEQSNSASKPSSTGTCRDGLVTPVFTLPGINSSGPTHWQSLWEQMHPDVQRIEQKNWKQPVCSEWITTIERYVSAAKTPPILVAHSLGCLAAMRWLDLFKHRVRGVILVAVPDPAAPTFPKATNGFSYLPGLMRHEQLILISSNNDPFASPEFSHDCAKRWGAMHIDAGHAGHLNEQSDLGVWPETWALVAHWRAPHSKATAR